MAFKPTHPDTAHPQADRIEAMARAAVKALGHGDPDRTAEHAWGDAWNPHLTPLPEPRGGAIPDILLDSPRWMLHTKAALVALAMADASREHDAVLERRADDAT